MSGAATDAAPAPAATPGASSSGPALGTAPAAAAPVAAPVAAVAAAPAAAPAGDAAPAASSSADAAPAETIAAAPTSILSEATDKPADASAAEAKPDEKPAAEVKPVEVARPTYAAFTVPEGVKLDDAQVASFTGLLGDFEQRVAADPSQAHAVAQEMGQKFLDLYLAESKSAAERWAQAQQDNWTRTREQWIAEGKADPEIGGNRFETTIQRAGAVLQMYGQQVGTNHEQAVRTALGMTGAGDNPAMWRFMEWVARRTTERSRPVPALVPRAPMQTGSKAERLYRNSPGAA